MHISEENLNTQQITLQCIEKRYESADVDDMNVNNVKLYLIIPPSLNFYQWNDFGKSTD